MQRPSLKNFRIIVREESSTNRAYKSFFLIFSLISLVYGIWLYSNWPGNLGNDSMAALMEATDKTGQISSGKTAVWIGFIKLILALNNNIGAITTTQMLISAFVFSRIIHYIYRNHGILRSAIIFTFFAVTPHILNFSGTIYPDGLFSVCGVGLVFEIWICLKRSKVTRFSAFFIFLCLPFAIFARSNGAILLIPYIYLLFNIERRSRLIIASIGIFWTLTSIFLSLHQNGKPQEAIYPLVIFETANFVQPHPFSVAFGLPAYDVSGPTVEVLEKYGGIQKFNEWYDRDYWDSLVHQPDSPNVLAISLDDQQILIKEFLSYNLWHNIPAFLSSRVNVFIVSAFAEGHFPTAETKSYVLNNFKNNYSELSPSLFFTKWTTTFNSISWKYRFLLWSPFFGIAMLAAATVMSWKRMKIDYLVIHASLVLQLIAIFLFSSAGEYRYLLTYFLLPIVLYPMICDLRRGTPRATKMA